MKQEKIINGDKIFNVVIIDGFEEIVAQGKKDGNDHYRLYSANSKNPFGTLEYESNDFLLTMREFTRRISARLDAIEIDRLERGNPMLDDAPLKDSDCVPNGLNEDITNKIIAIKSDSFFPEYRTRSHQLHIATGGFGAISKSGNKMVFATNIFSGEKDNFYREDILGVVLPERIPEWAHEKIAALTKEHEPENAVALANKPPNDSKKQLLQYESVIAKIDEDKNKPPRNRRYSDRKTSERDL